MSAPRRPVGILLAGGRGTRMGRVDKCLLQFGATSLLANAIERLGPQVATMVINANGDPERFASFGLPVVADTVPGFVGPLAGILAGMRWAETNAPEILEIATVATDTPFFPIDLVPRLTDAIGSPGRIAIALSRGKPHFVFGVFPMHYADGLERHIKEGGSLRVADWLETTGYACVDFDDPPGAGHDPFFNVNAPADLTAAQGLLRGFGQG